MRLINSFLKIGFRSQEKVYLRFLLNPMLTLVRYIQKVSYSSPMTSYVNISLLKDRKIFPGIHNIVSCFLALLKYTRAKARSNFNRFFDRLIEYFRLFTLKSSMPKLAIFFQSVAIQLLIHKWRHILAPNVCKDAIKYWPITQKER